MAVLGLVLLSTFPPGASWAGPARARGAADTPVTDPAALVHPLDGTGTGPVNPGTVGEFPGADLPFGMIQWSPDTSPDTVQAGGGYSYQDHAVNGFSLTHLSGTGCPSYQDVPILPTVGAVGPAPTSATATFSHAAEAASPGTYRVALGTGAPIGVSLAVTERTGIARFTFPPAPRSNVLFKVADSANPASAADVRVVGADTIEGQVTSGGFCGTGTDYTLHFVATFDRPFGAAGTWDSSGVSGGSTSCAGTTCGAYVSFDTTTSRTLLMKVGISFVSVADARLNLDAEDPGWSLPRVASAARARWNDLLGRIAVDGGTPTQQHIFYTALYHSLLFPNVVSDVNGDYAGSDGKVHSAGRRQEYADFSEWDIYRSQVQLASLLDPHAVGDMVTSLLDDTRQGGWLPKWAIVGGDEAQMNGDSADPIIADAYAMGVRNFDVHQALADMVKGATRSESGHGLQIERQYLSQYLTQHYVNAGSLDLTSIDYSIGGSVTLEYAIDDFAISQLATAEHEGTLAATMARRAANWEYLFDPATGYVGARGDDGSFPAGAAFQTAQLEPGGQTGFEEGNAVQYTWSVPQDLAALATAMGGDAAAATALRSFFSSLNATRDAPYEWSGNEPDEWAPWEFDWFGAPEDTQATVRRIADGEYADGPVDEPGNDDLGAISSWYVWAALGLFPVTPGAADLALASPLFPEVSITLPDGRHLVEHAPAAAAGRPYIHSVTVTGVARPVAATSGCEDAAVATAARTAAWEWPWLPASALTSGGTLTYSLSSTPDPRWGAAPSDAPPSFGAGTLPAIGFSRPGGSIPVAAGGSTTLALGAVPAVEDPGAVRWEVAGPVPGLQVQPDSGTLALAATGGHAGCRPPAPATQSVTVTAHGAGGTVPLRIDLQAADGLALPPVVVDVVVAP